MARATAGVVAGVVPGSCGPPAVHCAHVEMVAVADLRPNPWNPNTHPPAQVAALASIIAEQGWRAPITVSRQSGFVVRGHGRLLAAKRLGLAHVPVDWQTYESEAAEWADLVADNRIAELAEIDEAQLAKTLTAIQGSGIDMDLTGFDAEALAATLSAISAGVVVDETGLLPEDFDLPDGDIDEKSVMVRVVVFVQEPHKRDLIKRLIEIGEEYGTGVLRVMR